ncbi:MAG: HAMP domain-containing protein [Candidatus Omnitrophica bacterium]|nr:HAMP domain-containing protein [Candidatus Omnitrophota bacterium]
MAIKYLNRSLQSRYLFLIILSMIIPTVFVGGCLYYFIFTVLAEQIALPDFIARDLLPVVYRINLILAVGLPIVFVGMLSWAVVLSYRFVAPLERLEEDIKRIDEGDYSVRLQVNKDHDLKPIADVINDLVDKLDREGV